MSEKVKPIPKGYHTITPHLVVKGCAEAIEFYTKAFDAEELGRHTTPDGKAIMHAALEIGDSRLFVADEAPEMGSKSPQSLGGTPVGIHLYVKDVDKTFQQAVDAGATVVLPVGDQFWGDRYGKVADPFGHQWSIASRVKKMSPEEIDKAAEEFFAASGKKEGACV